MATQPTSPASARLPHVVYRGRRTSRSPLATPPRRLASNFAALSLAELVCRGTSVGVTLSLARHLGKAYFGRIEFAFNLVCWLVLLVREGFDVLGAREIARHPKLARPLVNHVMAIRGLIAAGLLAALIAVGGLSLRHPTDRAILWLYGLMLMTTALGLDFVFRGLERMGLIAVSLMIRTAVYAVGVTLFVAGPERVVWVPAFLVAGEACGIALVWTCYVRRFGLPRPTLSGSRFARVFLRRGRSVYFIQVSQAVIGSVDLLVVGLLSRWADVGLYSAPHRMVGVLLTFGLIFQQVVFPSLARSWREASAEGRRAVDALVRVLMMGMIPVAVGATALAGPLVRLLFRSEYDGASLLLAVGIWRAPLLTLAFLYQTALIALNREAVGVRLLAVAAIVSGPLVALLALVFGPLGALAAIAITGLSLAATGYACLAREGRQPAWHHHLGRPFAAAMVMVPACLMLERVHVLLAIGGGAAVYLLMLTCLGGLRRDDLRAICGRV